MRAKKATRETRATRSTRSSKTKPRNIPAPKTADNLTPRIVSLSPDCSDKHNAPNNITKTPSASISSALPHVTPPQFESYQEMVIHKRKRNQEFLKSLGLDDTPLQKRLRRQQHDNDVAKKPPSSQKTQRELRKSTRQKNPLATQQRHSRRRRKQPPRYDDVTLDDLERVAKKITSAGSRQRRRRPLPAPPTELTKEQRDALSRAEDDWLSLFYDFLLTVPHGNGHKTVSEANARSVMKQVRLLVSGAGVTYHHWEDGVVFCKGRAILLGDDLEELYDEAQKFEDLHGRDLGNGWLLRHPIVKLRNYQAYRASKGV
mmetsp:Transcript_16346/g.20361  ORF Transcript_16346/g.20361 Transcript_16346/m.20361 type:complete len:316 (+) Transcript_16346:206-1153(+)|eukprot:CAMPEP_0172479364 /NCGR_PEP_ID=MMETSP1066-20121228/3892_1 /TAXON_ID=671091 /ORGANISM="Coscinodiscus wailesii, Strain CCMP2513" /LENGTH=315 /DNA_ID=CAMNT_0013239767 /DNA_START=159 /DNA_END=1106 /DNA_ORIENTATION=-